MYRLRFIDEESSCVLCEMQVTSLSPQQGTEFGFGKTMYSVSNIKWKIKEDGADVFLKKIREIE